MQRALLIFAVALLVMAGLGAGVLAAHWPFWARAWQWHTSAGWPASLPGPTLVLHGGTATLPLQLEAVPLPDVLAGTDTQMLLVAGADGRGVVFAAAGFTADSRVDGRGLAIALLPPLYALMAERYPGVLDASLGTFIRRWQGEARGQITPRQLFWQMSGLPALEFNPLNPASVRAELASGPDFERTVRRWPQQWPAGTHFEESPVNAQLLALVAARQTDTPFGTLLEQKLWSQVAAADAVATLDHPHGNIAAHCCIAAAATDWLRLALLLADDGRVGSRQLVPAGFSKTVLGDSPIHPGYGQGFRIVEAAGIGRAMLLETPGRVMLVSPGTHRALLWVGSGAAPAMLHRLLAAETASPQPGDRLN